MKFIKTTLWACFTILILSHTSISQQSSVFTLNQFDEKALISAKENPEGKSYYTLNEEIFSNPSFGEGAILEIQKRDGNVEQLVILDREEYMPGAISIRAFKVGNKDKIFVATFNNGTLNGIFYDTQNQNLYFGNDIEMSRNFMSTKEQGPDGPFICGTELLDVEYQKPGISRSKTETNKSNSLEKAALNFSSVDDSVTIDLMIVYTEASENWANTESGFGDINGAIAQIMNTSQLALDNSETGIKLRLVHSYKTNYDEVAAAVGFSDTIGRFRDNAEVNALRNQYGADIVSMLVDIDPEISSGTRGIGYLGSFYSGNDQAAFNVNDIRSSANAYVVIHEIGHNMGNAHARTQVSNAAGDKGGLFEYSTGYQSFIWNFATVMGYAEQIPRIPYFSSPDITFNGATVGTATSNNARSLREIKRVISNHRPSVVDPPSASLLADVISIEMNREDNLSIPFQIFNDGDSPLVWDIDFRLSSNNFKRKINNAKTIAPANFDRIIRNPASYTRLETSKSKSALAEEVLYTTSFEGSEGFDSGTHEAEGEWRAVSNDEFSISSENAKSGSQHLRILGDGGGSSKFIGAPFFGYQQFGNYEITVNFSISSATEGYDFYVFDGKSGEFSSAIIYSDGTIFAADLDEVGNLTFFSTSAVVNTDQYYELKMVIDPDNRVVRYTIDGNIIAENSILKGFSPGEMQILNRNSENGSAIDVDDIEIKKISAPYPWLSTGGESTGVTFEGASSSRSINFSTVGISAGTYRTTMRVSTSDPLKEVINVPITLNVSVAVSNEEEEIPTKLLLKQNYPNPFNPSTTISYTLENADDIQLEVFNIQGQRIATLFNGKQQQGEHEISFDASNLSSGVYLYRLKTSSIVLTRQMILIK